MAYTINGYETAYKPQASDSEVYGVVPFDPKDVAPWVVRKVEYARQKRKKWYYNRTVRWRNYLYAEPKIERPDPWMSQVKLNLIHDGVEKMVAVGTDSRPTFMVLPRKMSAVPMAQVMSDIQRYIWDFRQMDSMTEHSLRHLLVAGMVWVHVGWDPWATRDAGDVDIRLIDARRKDWDCDVDVVEDRLWDSETSFIPREIACARWQWLAADLKKSAPGDPHEGLSENPGSQESAVESETVVPRWDLGSPSDSGRVAIPPRHDTPRTKIPETSDRLKLITMYIRPSLTYDNMRRPVIGPGRRIVVCGGVLVSDTTNPFWDSDRHPFPDVPLYANQIAGELPEGLTRQVEPIQQQLGEVLRALSDHVVKEGHTQRLIARGTVRTEDVESRRYNLEWDPDPSLPDGGVPRIMNVNTLGDANIQVYRLLLDAFDLAFGIHDPDRGADSGETTAAAAIKALQRIFIQGVRLAQRNQERMLDQVGNRSVSRVEQFYTTERTFRVVGADDPMLFATIRPHIVMDEFGIPLKIVSPFYDSGGFDFEIKTGSAMPPDPDKLMQLGLLMADRGWINPRQLVGYTTFKADGPYFSGAMAGAPSGAPSGARPPSGPGAALPPPISQAVQPHLPQQPPPQPTPQQMAMSGAMQ